MSQALQEAKEELRDMLEDPSQYPPQVRNTEVLNKEITQGDYVVSSISNDGLIYFTGLSWNLDREGYNKLKEIAEERGLTLEENNVLELIKEGLVVISTDGRKLYFLLVFTIAFLVLSAIVGYLIKLPLIV